MTDVQFALVVGMATGATVAFLVLYRRAAMVEIRVKLDKVQRVRNRMGHITVADAYEDVHWLRLPENGRYDIVKSHHRPVRDRIRRTTTDL